MFVGSIMLLAIPQHMSIIVLNFRFFTSIFICYGNYLRFNGAEPCGGESLEVTLQYERDMYVVRNEIIYVYI